MKNRRDRRAAENSKRGRKAGDELKPSGYDHGIKQRRMSLGSWTFVENLSAADIDGVAYGFDREPSLGITIPIVSLIGRNVGPMQKAFDEFAQWSTTSDGDAVELTFVFLKSGGYLLGVTVEPHRLLQRTLRFDTTYEQLAATLTWVKELDSTSGPTLDFKRHKKRLVSPFLFGACVHNLRRGALQHWQAPVFSPIPTRLLKFEASIVEEDEITAGTPAEVVMHATGRTIPGRGTEIGGSSYRGPPKATPTEIREARTTALRRHFPVTLERIQASEAMLEMRARSLTREIESWQFDQAVCNLLLSSEMTGGRLHFEGVARDELKEKVAQAIASRYEAATGRALLPACSIEQIMKQVELDAIFLLQEFGDHAPITTFDDVMRRLKKQKLLTRKGSGS